VLHPQPSREYFRQSILDLPPWNTRFKTNNYGIIMIHNDNLNNSGSSCRSDFHVRIVWRFAKFKQRKKNKKSSCNFKIGWGFKELPPGIKGQAIFRPKFFVASPVFSQFHSSLITQSFPLKTPKNCRPSCPAPKLVTRPCI